MPIYAYRCEECGFSKDVLQKMSDDPLSICIACGKPGFKKQVTAAGFQLKGSGWYVTDFRDGKGGKAATGAAGGVTAANPAAEAPATAAKETAESSVNSSSGNAGSESTGATSSQPDGSAGSAK